MTESVKPYHRERRFVTENVIYYYTSRGGIGVDSTECVSAERLNVLGGN